MSSKKLAGKGHDRAVVVSQEYQSGRTPHSCHWRREIAAPEKKQAVKWQRSGKSFLRILVRGLLRRSAAWRVAENEEGCGKRGGLRKTRRVAETEEGLCISSWVAGAFGDTEFVGPYWNLERRRGGG